MIVEHDAQALVLHVPRHLIREQPHAKTAAILRFARKIVLERGAVGAAGLASLRDARVTDAEALEVVTNVVLNIFTNYVNLVADTEIDFPVVRASSR